VEAQGHSISAAQCSSYAQARCGLVGGEVNADFCRSGGAYCKWLKTINHAFAAMCATDTDCQVLDGVLVAKTLCCDEIDRETMVQDMCLNFDKVKAALLVGQARDTPAAVCLFAWCMRGAVSTHSLRS
jgi:hypothetical protein